MVSEGAVFTCFHLYIYMHSWPSPFESKCWVQGLSNGGTHFGLIAYHHLQLGHESEVTQKRFTRMGFAFSSIHAAPLVCLSACHLLKPPVSM